MRFTSKYAGLNVPILDDNAAYNADGQKRVIPSADGTRSGPAVYVDFGEAAFFGEEVLISDLDGEKSPIPDIRGGIYDTDEAAKAHGWTDWEKAEVERRLLQLCPNNPNPDLQDRRIIGYGDVEVYETPKPVAPWQKYDTTKPERIPAMADAFGNAQNALIYEERTRAREGVMKGLQAIVDRDKAAEEAGDLTAV